MTALLGFGIVFLVCTWGLSAFGGILLAWSAGRIQRVGPRFERRIATLVAFVPLGLGIAVTAVLLAQSALGSDHCTVHDHHAHLCLTHGAHWLELPSVTVALAIGGVTVLARAALFVRAYVRGARSARLLRAASREHDGVRLVDSARAFAFVGGAGEVYVSTRVWEALSVEQRAAMLAHEAAHIANGDLGKRVALELALMFAAPLVGGRVLSMWLSSSERLCDARAAQASSPEVVADAMVALCRLQIERPANSFGFTPSSSELARRIEAVLNEAPLGSGLARLTGRIALVATGVLVTATAVAAEPLHHAFETLLG